MIEVEGIPYTTKNGIKVALHQEAEGWLATELSTGMLCVTSGGLTRTSVKSEVEKNSPIVLKLLKKFKKEKEKPDVKELVSTQNKRLQKKEQKMKLSKARHSDPRPNPFVGADDIYITKNKVAVTTTQGASSKRGYTKVTKTKYYEQNETNKRLLRKANKNTVRVGRTGNNYKTL